MLSMFPGSIFIQSPQEFKEKNMQDVEVRGNFKSRAELLEEAIKVAKERANLHPIIFFCKDD